MKQEKTNFSKKYFLVDFQFIIIQETPDTITLLMFNFEMKILLSLIKMKHY